MKQITKTNFFRRRELGFTERLMRVTFINNKT